MIKKEDFEKYKDFCKEQGLSPCRSESLSIYYKNK